MARQPHVETPAMVHAGPDRGRAFMNRVANPVVKAVLRSQFHRLFSGNTMLITFRGRKSGREYTTPVNYVREGDIISVVSRTGRCWWRNLVVAAPVSIRLKGRDLAAWAAVEPVSGYELVAAYTAFRERLGHPVSVAKAAEAARDVVLLKVEINQDDGKENHD